MKIVIKTKDKIFDCTGELLYKGKNKKSVYTKYNIGINNKFVYVVKSEQDGQIRAFYKKELI